MMKIRLLIAGFALGLLGCQKNPVSNPSPDIYTDFKDSLIKYNQSVAIDMDHSGSTDFEVVISLIQQNDHTYTEFRVVRKFGNKFLFQAEVPAIFNSGEKANIQDSADFKWTSESSALLLAQEYTPGMPGFEWKGVWKNQTKKSLAVQLLKNNQKFYGWLRFSFAGDLSEGIIFHDALLSATENNIPPAL